MNHFRLFAFLLLFIVINIVKGQNNFDILIYEKDFKYWAFEEGENLKKIICNNLFEGKLALYNNKFQALLKPSIDSVFKLYYDTKLPQSSEFYSEEIFFSLNSPEENIKHLTFSKEYIFIHHAFLEKIFLVKKLDLKPLLKNEQQLFLNTFCNEKNNDLDSFKAVSEIIYRQIYIKLDSVYCTKKHRLYKDKFLKDTVMNIYKRLNGNAKLETLIAVYSKDSSEIMDWVSSISYLSKPELSSLFPMFISLKNIYPQFKISAIATSILTTNTNEIRQEYYYNFDDDCIKFNQNEKLLFETIIAYKIAQKTQQLTLNADDLLKNSKIHSLEIYRKIYNAINNKKLAGYLANGKKEAYKNTIYKLTQPQYLTNCLPPQIIKSKNKHKIKSINSKDYIGFNSIKLEKEFSTIILDKQYPCNILVKSIDLHSILDSAEIAFLNLYKKNNTVYFDSLKEISLKLFDTINAKVYNYSQLEKTSLYLNDSFKSRYTLEYKNRRTYNEVIVAISGSDPDMWIDSVTLIPFNIFDKTKTQGLIIGTSLNNSIIEPTWISTGLNHYNQYLNPYGYLKYDSKLPLTNNELLYLINLLDFKLEEILKKE